MTAVWASCHEDLVSDGVVSPPLCDPKVGPALGAVRAQCNSPGSAVDAGLDAAARARRVERAVDSGVWYVSPALQGSPCAPPITAHRVAQLYHYCTRNCIPLRKLRRDIR
jgi:hypothetical protein